MILFEKQFVDSILSGSKTRTYRSWKKPRCKVGSVHQAKTDYSVGSLFAHLLIASVRSVRLADITDEDAKADGFDNAYMLRAYFGMHMDTRDIHLWEVKSEVVKPKEGE